MYPTVNIEADGGYTSNIKTYDNFPKSDYKGPSAGLTLSVSYPIYDAAYWAQYNKSKLEVERGAIKLDKDKNTLMLQVVQYYLEVLSAMDDVEYIKLQKESLAEQMQQTSERVRVGQARVIDVEQIKSRYELSKAEEILYENNLKVKKEQLDQFLNYKVKSYKTLKDVIDNTQIQHYSLESWQQAASSYNLDILYAKISVLLADEDILKEEKTFYPTVSLLGNYGVSRTRDPARSTQANVREGFLGLSVKLNLYAGGLSVAQKQQYIAVKNSSYYNVNSLISDMQVLISQYYLNVYNGLSRIEALKQAEFSSKRFLEAAKKSYGVGLSTNTDVLIANEAYFNDKRNLSQAKHAFLLSIVSLKSVVGNLKIQDIAEISSYLE